MSQIPTSNSLSRAEEEARRQLSAARRVVVKLGSGLLSDQGTGLAVARVQQLVKQFAELQASGIELVVVSSGAVVEGCLRLGLSERPQAENALQAVAAVGQVGLMAAYEKAFAAHQRQAAMVLLTHEDIADRTRYLNARSTLLKLLELGVCPVVNENDTVATDEIRFGDNDTLAGLVSNLIDADLLLLLTDMPGLYDMNPTQHPDAQMVSWAASEDPRLDQMAGRSSGRYGQGGMATKLASARLAARSGAHTVIARGSDTDVVASVLNGARVGTVLSPSESSPLLARKRWIADQRRVAGVLQVDDGAAARLREDAVSLLPVGVTAVTGTFRRGDLVSIVDALGRSVGQGLVNYDSEDVQRVLGLDSSRLTSALGYQGEPEMVHRDNLVVGDGAAGNFESKDSGEA